MAQSAWYMATTDGPAQLEKATKSDAWAPIAYPTAGEGVLVWRRADVDVDGAEQRALLWLYRTFGGEKAPTRPQRGLEGPTAADRDRSAAVAAARARTTVRRYCRANGLTRLLTLTYGGSRATTHAEAVDDVGRAMRRLRDAVGKFPYVWVPELHRDGEHYHVHLATGRPWAVRCNRCDPAGAGRGLQSRGAADPCLRCAWGRGFVHAKRLTATGNRPWQQETTAATYLAKYVGKSYEDHESGMHRYDCARGFKPVQIRPEPVASEREGMAALREVAGKGKRPRFVWSSDEAEDWHGPPTRVAWW